MLRHLSVAVLVGLMLPVAGPAVAQEDPLRVAKLMVVSDEAGGVTRQFFGQVVA